MHVKRIGHVNIRTPLFEETLAFYERVLGFRRGPGAAASAAMNAVNMWLHDASGAALIHVNAVLPGEAPRLPGSVGRIDHVAFDCVGLEACVARLEAIGVPFERISVTGRGLTQLNIRDPNDLKVELTFAE